MESMSGSGLRLSYAAVARRFVRCTSAVGVEAPATFVAPLGADPARLDEVAGTRPSITPRTP